MADVIDLTNDNFESEALKSGVPVLIDFWADWCGPCRMVEPTVHDFAGEYEGKLKVCRLNVDNAREIAAKYGIRSIPTLMLFKDGEVKDTAIGAQPKEVLKEFVDKNL